MADEWVVASLGDLVEIKHGYAFRGEFFRDEPIGDILLTPGNFAIGGGFRDNKFKYYEGPVPNDFVLKEGDLIVTMTDLSKNADTLGFAACVPADIDGRHFLHNQRLGKVTITNEQAADLGFIEYLMRSTEYRHEIVASATGTTVKHTSPERIKRFRFLLPPLSEQRAIACILGALDDKIDLNRRMNRTLEAMARALFQSWFVDFDPVRAKLAGQAPAGLKPAIAALFPDRLVEVDGREVPEGWRVGTIGDCVDCVKGKSYRSEELQDSDTALVTLKSFARGGGYRADGLKAFTGDFKPQQVIQPGELIVACTDVTQAAEVIGRPAIVQSSSVFDTLVASLDILIVRPRLTGLSVPFLYCLFRTDDFVNHTYAHSTGTTVLHLSKEAVPSFVFLVPPQPLLTKFGSIAVPIFSRIDRNERESLTLAALRDTLLPKLISGALRVPDAERIVGKCM